MFGSVDLSEHPVEVGTRSEAAVITELVRRGHRVLLPFGFNHRYDLVVDVNGRFVRAQVKTGRIRDGAVLFRGESIRCNMNGTHRRTYGDEIDVFVVYVPETGRIYVVPSGEVGTVGTLRLEPPANNQSAKVRWAADYELPV